IVFDLVSDANYRFLDDGEGTNIRLVFGRTAHAPLSEVAGPPVVPVRTPVEPTRPAQDLLQIASLPALPALPVLKPAQLPTVAASVALPAIARATPPAASPNPAPQTPAPTGPGTLVAPVPPSQNPQYTGEIISLDLKDYDIKDLFRLISEISGLNVVLD